jgi:aspartate aminotransferase-like enzyme
LLPLPWERERAGVRVRMGHLGWFSKEDIEQALDVVERLLKEARA